MVSSYNADKILWRTYGWTKYHQNKYNNMSPHPQGRDIIPNKYISRVYCVHFHLLTSDTFPVFFVPSIALTSYTGFLLHTARLLIYSVHYKKKKIFPKSLKFPPPSPPPETLTALGLLSVTINEIVIAAGCTYFGLWKKGLCWLYFWLKTHRIMFEAL